METLVYDRVTEEIVPKSELERRREKRAKPKRATLPRHVERGRWIYDRSKGKIVPASEYRRTTASAPQVIRDIEPYRSVVDGSIVGGRRQHRDHLKDHGCIEVGNERVPHEKKPMPRAGPDIKRAIEELSSR